MALSLEMNAGDKEQRNVGNLQKLEKLKKKKKGVSLTASRKEQNPVGTFILAQ